MSGAEEDRLRRVRALGFGLEPPSDSSDEEIPPPKTEPHPSASKRWLNPRQWWASAKTETSNPVQEDEHKHSDLDEEEEEAIDPLPLKPTVCFAEYQRLLLLAARPVLGFPDSTILYSSVDPLLSLDLDVDLDVCAQSYRHFLDQDSSFLFQSACSNQEAVFRGWSSISNVSAQAWAEKLHSTAQSWVKRLRVNRSAGRFWPLAIWQKWIEEVLQPSQSAAPTGKKDERLFCRWEKRLYPTRTSLVDRRHELKPGTLDAAPDAARRLAATALQKVGLRADANRLTSASSLQWPESEDSVVGCVCERIQRVFLAQEASRTYVRNATELMFDVAKTWRKGKPPEIRTDAEFFDAANDLWAYGHVNWLFWNRDVALAHAKRNLAPALLARGFCHLTIAFTLWLTVLQLTRDQSKRTANEFVREHAEDLPNWWSERFGQTRQPSLEKMATDMAEEAWKPCGTCLLHSVSLALTQSFKTTEKIAEYLQEACSAAPIREDFYTLPVI